MHRILKKTFITFSSLLMFLSVGTGISNVNAKRRSYRYRSHRVYRRNRKRRNRAYRRIRRHVKRYSGKFNWRSYVYNLKTKDELMALAQIYYQYGVSMHTAIKRTMHRFSYNGKTIPVFASSKRGFIPLKSALSSIRRRHISFARYFRNEQISKGRLYEDPDWGDVGARDPMFYTPIQLRHIAAANHESIREYKHKNTKAYMYHVLGLNSKGQDNDAEDNPENDANTVKQRILNELVQDRASVGESPLNEDPSLDNEAQQRSQELVSNFSHQNSNGQYASNEDSNVDAENIAFVDGEDPKDSADTMNNGLFYKEEPNDGGHYENIVNHNNVGVGVTVNDGEYYLAEDFN